VDTTRPQRKRTTQEHLGKISGAGNVGDRLQVLLEEDGDRAGWIPVVSGLCSTGSDKA